MDEARKILLIARELLALADIKAMYRRLNSRVFDGELPDVPEKRSFRGVSWFRVPQSLVDDVFNNGRELARVTTGEPTRTYGLA